MDKYQLTEMDIKVGIDRILMDIYSTAGRSLNPQLILISAGPGAGKTAIELFYKKKLKEQEEKGVIVNSDKIATYHPLYEEALEELPEDCYRITRQFVRPAAPIIFEELRQKNINIINENTLDKGESDFEMIKKFKESGYKVLINIMATDLYVARLSCFQREAKELELGLTPRGIAKENQERMYNSFVKEVYMLQEQNLCDEINVFARGKNINMPELVYKNGDNKYEDFYDAIISERTKQRKKLLNHPGQFLVDIEEVEKNIKANGMSKKLIKNSLAGILELKDDFIKELKQKDKEY